MNLETFRSWLDSYSRAWENRDPQVYADPFTDDAIYHVNPFSEPLHGRSSILDYWINVIHSRDQIQFNYEILAVTQDTGIAQWWVSFVSIPSKAQVKLDGIFVVSLTEKKRCRVFRQWWHWLEHSPE